MTLFDHLHPKIIESTLSFPEFVPAFRKSHMTRLAILIFDLAHPKNIWSAFNFCESVLTFKNEFIPSVRSSDIGKFRVPSPDWPKPSLTMLTLNIFNHLLVCVNSYQYAKNQLISSVHLFNFRVQRSDWPHPFLAMSNNTILNQLLIFVYFYQHEKNEAVSSICSREIVDLRILQTDWLRAHFYLWFFISNVFFNSA